MSDRIAPNLLAVIRKIAIAALPVYERGVPITCTAPPKMVQPYFDFTSHVGPDCVIGLLDEIERLREACGQVEWERDRVLLAVDAWIERERKALSKQGIISGPHNHALVVLEQELRTAMIGGPHE